MNMPQNRWWLAFCFAIACTGCAPGPDWDRQVGAAYSRMVADEMGIVENPTLQAYVSTIGHRMANAAPDRQFEYRFHVVDDEAPNAFALPGGYIYITRGLLALSNSEDELANVLGHEIGHVEERHGARQQAAGTLPGILAMPGDAVGAVISPKLGNVLASPFRKAGAAYLASYGRDQERDADRWAQEIAARAGYDPRGMSLLLEGLEREEILRTGEQRSPGFLDSHPPTPERAEATAKRATTLTWARTAETESYPDAYLRRLNGMVIGRDPAKGVFRGRRFMHPVLNCSAEIPEDWTPAYVQWAFGAISPEQDALLVAQRPVSGTDPGAAADAFMTRLEKIKPQILRSEPIRVGDLPGYGVTARLGRGRDAVDLELIWISYEERLYQLIGLAAAGQDADLEAIRATAQSFRPLTEAERDSIPVVRLRLVEARVGESLAQLGLRSGNAWSVRETAVMNDIEAGEPLEGGRVVKIAVIERFRQE
ncbi:MAG: M48 family metalloprotease [Planctomycetota bacterium]|jgi:predicted Zn-dependent protease